MKTEHIVTGNIGRFQQGQKLETNKDLAEYIRTFYNEFSEKGNTTLSDDQLIGIYSSIDTGDMEADEMAISDIVATGKVPGKTKPVTIAAGGREGDAKSAAIKADDDAVFNGLIGRLVAIKQEWEMRGVLVMEEMRRVFGVAFLDGMPYPGTRWDDEPAPNNPDIYERSRKNGPGKAQSSFVKDFADNIKFIRVNIRGELDKVAADKAAGKSNPITIQEREDRLNGQLSSARNVVSQGLALHHDLQYAETYKAIDIRWSMEQDPDNVGKTRRALSGKPITVINKLKPTEEFLPLSIQQFTSLKWDVARAKGETYESLIETLTRGADDDKDNGGITFGSVEEIDDGISGLVNALNDKGLNKLFQGRLLNHDDDDYHTLKSVEQLTDRLMGILAGHRSWIDEQDTKRKPKAA